MSTLILLPGMACDAALWQHQHAALAAAAPGAVLVADVHGRADSLPAMAALLLAEQPGDLLLAGCSLGGMLAMEAARQAPGRVRGLALLGTTARPDTPELVTLRTQAIAEFEAGRAEALRATADETVRPLSHALWRELGYAGPVVLVGHSAGDATISLVPDRTRVDHGAGRVAAGQDGPDRIGRQVLGRNRGDVGLDRLAHLLLDRQARQQLGDMCGVLDVVRGRGDHAGKRNGGCDRHSDPAAWADPRL